IPKRQPFSGDSLDLRAECPRLALAYPVHADVRAEQRHLQPANVELRRRLLGAVESADVRAVIGIAAHSPRQAAANRRSKRFPIALRIAAPTDRIALAARPRCAAPNDRRTVAVPLELPGCFINATVVEQWIDIVQPASAITVERNGIIRHVLAEVAFD